MHTRADLQELETMIDSDAEVFDRAAAAAEAPPEPAELPVDEPTLIAYANRLLQELEEVDAERGANAAAQKIQLESIRQRYAELDGPLAQRRERLEGELRRAYEALPRRGKKKSRELAFGVLGTRATPRRVEVEDETMVITALGADAQVDEETYALVVRQVTKDKIDHAALTNLIVARNWEPVPGTKIVPEDEKFYAKPHRPGPDARD